ncbi:MAG: sugar kinase [Clostridia bacterium]|nr:sugar kinase [Clostridia bacterium]
MNLNELTQILQAIRTVRVSMIGDLCLDAYWLADMKKSRLSRETPHYPLPVTQERYALGGGGNVAANLAALGVGNVRALSVVGKDWRAYVMRGCLSEAGIDDQGVLTDDSRITPCYCKPLRAGISDVVYEDPRLDFENDATLSAETEEQLLQALDDAAAGSDILAVCDQLTFGVITPNIRERLCEIAKKMPVIVDSRDRIALYRHAIVKPNDVEAAAATGVRQNEPEAATLRLSEKNGAPAIVTVGADGAIWCAQGQAVRVPAVKTAPPVDPVGAGDTFLAAFCAAYAAGVDGPQAVAFANLACAVTVKKIGMTGTASPEELLLLAVDEEA